MGSSKPKTVPSNLAGTTCGTSPKSDHLRAPRHPDAMESSQTVGASQRRILAGAAPIRGVKSRLLEVPHFPDARHAWCDGAALAASVLRWSADGQLFARSFAPKLLRL
ncbi:hypothetical protein ACSS6W_010292 [Trichoderma asperelloides]|uniref:Uncharacterized protein n=1 Tax=Trichoderma asperellum TaxID=101201 RepID=A0A6V8QZG3_TRIAP|nr:hypothetical protein TASIC1_0008025300 [Trichoderma asperellum]